MERREEGISQKPGCEAKEGELIDVIESAAANKAVPASPPEE